METEKVNMDEEIYKCGECMVLDVSWGQLAEGDKVGTRTIFRGQKASSGFKRTIMDNDMSIAITVYITSITGHSQQ